MPGIKPGTFSMPSKWSTLNNYYGDAIGRYSGYAHGLWTVLVRMGRPNIQNANVFLGPFPGKAIHSTLFFLARLSVWPAEATFSHPRPLTRELSAIGSGPSTCPTLQGFPSPSPSPAASPLLTRAVTGEAAVPAAR